MDTQIKRNNYTEQLVLAANLDQFNSFVQQRKKAWAEFKTTGFPEGKNEEYKFTPIARFLEKHFKASELLANDAATTFDASIQTSLEGHRLAFINGRYAPEASSLPGEEITILSLTEALKSHSDLLSRNFNAQSNSKDPFALFNSTFWQDGLFIHVPKNTHLKKPLVIDYQHDAREHKVASHTRLLILIEENASLKIIENTNSRGGHAVFNTIQEYIQVEKNASLSYCKVQHDPGLLIQVSNTTIHQHDSSKIDTYVFSLHGLLIRNNLNILIDGEGCESHFYGLYMPHGEALVDNHTVVDHRKPNSFSNELYKGLMDGHSKGVFNGKIFVRPQAQKTNAFQSNRNILLSENATINTKPQLEIWADDVKCSHGCTTGQLDEEALFYLQSRGIPKATAKAMLLYAFAGEVLEAVKDEKLKEYLDNMVSERLHKNF